MRQRAAKLIISILLFFAIAATAVSQTIEILPAADTVDEADPGTFFTKAFYVSNRGSLEENYTAKLTLPPGWRIVALDSNPVIPLKSGDTVFATVFVPVSAAAGVYALSLAISDRETDRESARYAFDVAVREKPGFDILVVDAPDYAIAGEVYQSLFRVQNTGNSPIELLIDVASRPDLDYFSEIQRIDLQPGEGRIFAVSVRTDQSAADRMRHTLNVTAVPAREELEPRNAAATVEILPRVSGEAEPYRTLPVGIAVKQALRHGETDTYGFLATVNTEGSLSESGDDEFTGYLKVPFDREGALFRENNEIAISYKNKPFDLFLGNTFFSVSTLTENSIYGTGARVEYAGDEFSIGGYHTETALSPPSVSQTAVWYGREFGDYGNLRLNLVDSINRVPPGTIDLLTSLEITKTPQVGPNTVFEYASDIFHHSGQAYRLVLGDTLPGFTYALETLSADPGFTGAIQDTELYSARCMIPFGQSLSVTADLRNNYSLLEQPVPALAQSRSVGFRWKISPESGCGVTYQRINDANLRDNRAISSEVVRFDYDRIIGKVRANAAAFVNRSFDSIKFDNTLKETYSGSLLCNLDDRQTLKGFTSVSTTRGAESSEILTFGLDYSADIGDRAGLRLGYRSSSKASSYYAGLDSVRASLVYAIAEGQRAMLQASYAPNRSLERFTDFDLSIEYHASVGLPIGLRQVGKIAGVVTDTATGRGVPDVIVRVGDRVAISDLSGRFLFLSMAEGFYTVGVDLSRLKEDRIVRGAGPIEVIVETGETADIEVFLIEPGVITGTVKKFSRDSDGNLVEEGGMPDLLLEVIGEYRKVRLLTDRNGNFRVGRLTPGEWVVTIASSQLADDIYVETDKPVITLQDGEIEEIFLGVYPVKREIKMIDEGTILGNGNGH